MKTSSDAEWSEWPNSLPKLATWAIPGYRIRWHWALLAVGYHNDDELTIGFHAEVAPLLPRLVNWRSSETGYLATCVLLNILLFLRVRFLFICYCFTDFSDFLVGLAVLLFSFLVLSEQLQWEVPLEWNACWCSISYLAPVGDWPLNLMPFYLGSESRCRCYSMSRRCCGLTYVTSYLDIS